jgi:hypothetical protein
MIPGTMGVETQFAPNLTYEHELSKEESIRSKIHSQRLLFDFSWEFDKTKKKEIDSNLLIHIMLPYEKIIYAKENDSFKVTLELEALIKDSADKVIWQFKDKYDLSFQKDFLIQNRESSYDIEVPVEKWLKKGNYSVFLHLKNLSGNQEIKKFLPLKI